MTAVPIDGSIAHWSMSVHVKLSGERGDPDGILGKPAPGIGNLWGVMLGDRAFLVGQNTSSSTRAFISVNAGDGLFADLGAAAFVECSATLAWTTQDYYTDTGHARGVVGAITLSAGGASLSYIPPLHVFTGLPAEPSIQIVGQSAKQGANAGGTGSITMSCSMGPCGMTSLLPVQSMAIYDKIAFYNLFGIYPGWTVVNDWLAETGDFSTDGSTGTYTCVGYPFAEPYTGPYVPITPPPDVITPSGVEPSVNYPVGFLLDTSFGGSGIFGGGSVPVITLLRTSGLSEVAMSSTAMSWPSGEPVDGVPVAMWNSIWLHVGQADLRLNPIISPTNVLDGSKVANGKTHGDGIGPTGSFQTYGVAVDPGVSGLACDLAPNTNIGLDLRQQWAGPFPTVPVDRSDANWLMWNNLDPRQVIGFGSPGQDFSAQIKLWTSPVLLTVGRQSSRTVDNGQSAAAWKGVDTIRGVTILANSTWTISQHADGTHVSFPPATSKSDVVHGVQRVLSGGGDAGNRRAFRNWRYCRIRIVAPVASTISLVLQTNNNGDLTRPGSSVHFDNLALVAGENVLVIDLARSVGTSQLFVAPHKDGLPMTVPSSTSVGLPAGPDPLGFWVLGSQDTSYRFHSAYKTANPTINGTAWQNQDVWFVRLNGLTPGQEYVIEEITCYDRVDGDRTPLRVLGDCNPNGSLVASSNGKAFDGSSASPSFVFRILANGRPVAGFPSCRWENTADLVMVDDLVARWMDTIDGGAGAWTINNERPDLTALIPASWLEVVPGSVTSTGFQLRACAKYFGSPGGYVDLFGGDTLLFDQFRNAQPTIECGYTETTGLSPVARYEWGSVVEGIFLDATSRMPIAGKTITCSTLNLPTSDTAIVDGIGVTDDDGYFAIEGVRQPLNVLHTLSADDDPTDTAFNFWLAHRNSMHVMIFSRISLKGEESDLAQDLSHGRIYRLTSDPTSHALMVETREGYSGLDGDPVSTRPILDSVSGQPRSGIGPSMWVDSLVGRVDVAYQRVSDGAMVVATSMDGLATLGAESMSLFSRSGGLPLIIKDNSSGVSYVFAAFPSTSAALSDVLLVRLDSTGQPMTWPDATTEKTVAAAVPAAGRPSAIVNRYDGPQTILLYYGDLQYQSTDGGNTWSVVS